MSDMDMEISWMARQMVNGAIEDLYGDDDLLRSRLEEKNLLTGLSDEDQKALVEQLSNEICHLRY
jgi:hypothetical protein